MEFLVRWTGYDEALLGLLETQDNLSIEEVIKFIVHIHILIRAYTFDDSVMTQLIDSAAFRLSDHIGPLTKDPTGWMNAYHGIIHFW